MLRSLLENAAEPGMGWIAHGPMDNFRIRPGFHVLLVAVQLQCFASQAPELSHCATAPELPEAPPTCQENGKLQDTMKQLEAESP